MFATRNIAHVLTVCFCILLILKVVQSKNTIILKNTSTESGYDKLSNSFNVFMLDADGVLWSGSEVIPGSAEFVRLLLHNKKKVYVISNAMRPISAINKKLADMKFTVPGVSEIFRNYIYIFFWTSYAEGRG